MRLGDLRRRVDFAQILLAVAAVIVQAGMTVWRASGMLFGEPSALPLAYAAVLVLTITIFLCSLSPNFESRVEPLSAATFVAYVALLATRNREEIVENVALAQFAVLAALLMASASRGYLWRASHTGLPSVSALFAACVVALLGGLPTGPALPDGRTNAARYVAAYPSQLAAVLALSRQGALVRQSADGLDTLPDRYCKFAARCEILTDYRSDGVVVFVPTAINWRNESAEGLLHWDNDAPPGAVEAFTAHIGAVANLGNGWWWGEPTSGP